VVVAIASASLACAVAPPLLLLPPVDCCDVFPVTGLLKVAAATRYAAAAAAATTAQDAVSILLSVRAVAKAAALPHCCHSHCPATLLAKLPYRQDVSKAAAPPRC